MLVGVHWFQCYLLPSIRDGCARYAPTIRFIRPEFQIFHVISTGGAFVLGFGILLAYGVLIYAAKYGKRCGSNPFRAASLEWQSSSPPDFHNFVHQPIVTDPYDFDSQVYDEELDTYIPRELADPAKTPPRKEPVHH